MSVTRLFVIPTKTKPTPHPDGGVFHLLPMTQVEFEKLAKKIVVTDYVRDRGGKTVFNQHGNAVPKFDQDPEVTVEQVMTKPWCTRIDDVEIPVYIGEEQQFEEDGTTPKKILVAVDNTTAACEDDHETLAGRCPARVKVKDVRAQCGVIAVGDYRATAAEVMKVILSGSYEYELPKDEEGEQNASPDADEPKPKKKVKPKTARQLMAEWVVERCLELGEAKREAEEKNL